MSANPTPTDKRFTVQLFRERLEQAMDRAGTTRAGLARRIGVDRSTLSQVLSSESVRLPRADTVAAIASALQVSLDWLLGLTESNQLGADILERAPEISPRSRAPEDENLRRWYAEAAGYKIRYVPTNLPDPLKITEVVSHEYREAHGLSADQAMRRSLDRLDYARQPETDIEICTSIQMLRGFVLGQGIWEDLDVAIRIRQLTHIADLIDELYPSLRWYLYDGRSEYAVPVTIFGPKRAALYVGNMYLVFTTTDHIRVLTRRFDDLIRRAVIQAHEVPDFVRRQIDELQGGTT
ncbi:helix-turn-helix domain-containing protein [Thalassobaculum sp.]|uniref:helix-turn-helix domain-containing protein n=1 Tax=Thalassobaculum sp. TaxID=2022740 RepID=UPI0032EB86F8